MIIFLKKFFSPFLENIDPYQRYLYQSDIDMLSKYKYRGDDSFNQPDLEFFKFPSIRDFDPKKLLMQYVPSQEVLSNPFDFQLEETFNFDIEDLQYVNSKIDLVERWRQLMKVC